MIINQKIFKTNFRCILTYCQLMSYLNSRCLDSIKSGLPVIESLPQKYPGEAYMFYGLAKYYITVKKPEEEIDDVIKRGLALLNGPIIKVSFKDSKFSIEWIIFDLFLIVNSFELFRLIFICLLVFRRNIFRMSHF